MSPVLHNRPGRRQSSPVLQGHEVPHQHHTRHPLPLPNYSGVSVRALVGHQALHLNLTLRLGFYDIIDTWLLLLSGCVATTGPGRAPTAPSTLLSDNTCRDYVPRQMIMR